MTTISPETFAVPLVLGASISAGYGTRDGGLGAVLAKTINPQAKVTNKAVSGATSVQSTAHLDFSKYSPSVVLGLDLFFWDAAREQTGKRFLENTDRLFKGFRGRNIPMIVAKVPVLDLPFGARSGALKASALKVNSVLESYAHSDPGVLLYDPVPCFMHMGDGEYFSDGLHLNESGNRFCAEFFVKSFTPRAS